MPNLYQTAPPFSSLRRRPSISGIRQALFGAAKARHTASARPLTTHTEMLESRTMLSVSTDANGWTVITPEAGDHVIYVSTSQGNDNNTGLSTKTPVRSLARGEAMVRNNSGDQLLLKAGDTWHEGFGIWTAGGKSATEPVVIGSYGTGARPLIDSGMTNGIQTGLARVHETDHVSIIGLHFYADGRDPNSPTYVGTKSTTGIDWLTQTDGLLIENTQVEGYSVNINVQGYYGPIKNVQVRRCIVDDAYATATHSEGLYATGVSNLLLEGNTFDHNGYNENIRGAGATYYNHNIYLASDTSGVVVQDNVISRAASYGIQARSGGTIQNNLFVDDPMGMSFGLVNGAMAVAGGVSGSITGNVFLGGGSVGSTPGLGIEIGNLKPGAGVLVANNIFAHGPTTGNGAIIVSFGSGQTNQQQTVGINDLTIKNNIVYQYRGGIGVAGELRPGTTGSLALNHLVITGNQFSQIIGSTLSQNSPIDPKEETWAGNYYSQSARLTVNFLQAKLTSAGPPPAYVDPQRSVASYFATLGGTATTDAFIKAELQQSHAAWNPLYDAQTIIDYISAGFD